MTPEDPCSAPDRSQKKNFGLIVASLSLFMLAFSYASVPLYRLFCQKTGFGGTTQIAKAPSERLTDRMVTIRFAANVHRDLPWKFRPQQNELKIHVGDNALALYEAENFSDKPIVGMATYNVTPEKAAIYFNKVACFCFDEQRLEPRKKMDMPVYFFIDPAFVEDPNMKDVNTITLSYTFFRFTN